MNLRMKNGNKKSALQLSLMIFLTLLAQLLALYKSRFTATSFGATDYMDAYNFALNIATFLFAFVTTGVTTVIIPAYVNKTDKKAVNSFITIIYSAIIVIVALVFALRFPIIGLLTNRGDGFTAIVGDFLLITFIIQGMMSLMAVTTGYYQVIDHYNIPKAIALAVNLGVVIVLLSGWITDIYTYLILLVSGSVLNFVVDVAVAIKYGFRYKPSFDIKNSELKRLLIIFLPTLFSSGVYKIHTMVDTTIATNLSAGNVTVLSYSTQIVTMVNTVIIGNLTVYVYPKIVARLGEKDSKRNLWDYSILFHAVVVLIIAAFITVGYECISVIFKGGRFTEENTMLLYICTCIYIFGQQFNIVRDLIYRYFYANGNTKSTLYNSIIISAMNIVLSLIMVIFWGVIGIIIGTVVSSLLSLVLILFRFRKHYGIGVKFTGVLLEYGKNIIALAVSVGAVLLLKQVVVLPTIVSLIVYGLLTAVIYLGVILLLKSRVRHVRF